MILKPKLSDSSLDRVLTASNGLGGSTEIAYTSSAGYLDTVMPFSVQTVTSMVLDDGFNNLSSTSILYEGGVFSYEDRDFRGFGKVVTTNPDGTKVETTYHQDDYRKGRPETIEFKDPGNTLLSRMNMTWMQQALNYPANNSYFVKLSQKRTEKYDNQTVWKQENSTYDDSNGNLLTQVLSGTDGETVTTEFSNYTNYGKPQMVTITGSASGLVRKTTYRYKTGTGNMLWREFWNDSGDSPRINYSYDNYGNVKTVTDARGNSTITEYETVAHTYPSKITYPTTSGVSHVEEFTYDYRHGKVKAAKDENGNITTHGYDEFGAIQRINYPDGGYKEIQYNRNEFPRYMVTSVKVNAGGELIERYDYVDGFGRPIQTISSGEMVGYVPKSIVTRQSYDNMGRLYYTYGPYFSDVPGAVGYPIPLPAAGGYPWVERNYDDQGRPVSVRNGDGQNGTPTTWFSYSGLSTTVTDRDGKQRTEKKDYLGRLVMVTEHANTGDQYTYYSYNAAGDLTSVMDHNGNVTSMYYDTLGRKWKMVDPDMGEWKYWYDKNGNMTMQRDAKYHYINFTYDELNRLKTKEYSSTGEPTVSYTYDTLTNGVGRLSSVTNTHVTRTILGYDVMGRVTSERKTIGTNNYDNSYLYDLSGKITRITYPDGYAVDYIYYPCSNLLHKVIGVSDQKEYVDLANYSPEGKIGSTLYGNGFITTYTYDPWTTRLINLTTSGNLQNISYEYTGEGDILQIDDNQNNIVYSYTYDNLHRLTSETNTGSYPANSYTYDAIGNIMSRTVGATTYDYSYGAAHKLSSISNNGVPYPPYEYDNNGNVISAVDFTDPYVGATREITYDADNMPIQVVYEKDDVTTIANFLYDGTGGRAQKSIQGGSTTYYVGDHYEVKDGTAAKYIFAGNLRIAKITGSTVQYYHKDHLGSSAIMTDASGAVIEITEYAPFGPQRAHTGSTVTNYKYTDQEFDPETGLYYYGARYYDPMIGRFISADIIVQAPSDPQTLNRYSYCRNSPLIYVDPTGHNSYNYGDYPYEWTYGRNDLTDYSSNYYSSYNYSNYSYTGNNNSYTSAFYSSNGGTTGIYSNDASYWYNGGGSNVNFEIDYSLGLGSSSSGLGSSKTEDWTSYCIFGMPYFETIKYENCQGGGFKTPILSFDLSWGTANSSIDDKYSIYSVTVTTLLLLGFTYEKTGPYTGNTLDKDNVYLNGKTNYYIDPFRMNYQTGRTEMIFPFGINNFPILNMGWQAIIHVPINPLPPYYPIVPYPYYYWGY